MGGEKELIALPLGAEEGFRVGLDKLADELLESVSKRRTHKDK